MAPSNAAAGNKKRSQYELRFIRPLMEPKKWETMPASDFN